MLKSQNHKKEKVLIIARAFPPFLPVGHSIRVIKFIKYLPSLGWEPVILTVDDKKEYETLPKVGSEVLFSELAPIPVIHRTNPGEPTLEFLQREKEFGKKNKLTHLIVRIIGGARRWIFRNGLLPDRTITWLPSAVKRGWHVMKSESIDLIFVTCPPHASTLIGALLKRLTGKPLVLDFRDDWIDTPWHSSKPPLIRWLDKQLEKWVIHTADKVILVTEWSRQAFQDRYPKQPREKFVLITNGCDLNDLEILKVPQPQSHTATFTIVHAGSLNISKIWGRSPAGLFKAIQKILQEQPELKTALRFEFAGDLPEDFQKLANEMGLSEVIHGVGHLPHEEILKVMKSANLLLAINYEGWATLIPGKIYEYWAVGGPPILLLSCPGAAVNFVEEHNLGHSVDPYDVEGIQRVIVDVYEKWKSGTPMKINTDGIEAFDRKALTKNLAQVLSTVIMDGRKSSKATLAHA